MAPQIMLGTKRTMITKNEKDWMKENSVKILEQIKSMLKNITKSSFKTLN